jgi:hypothetical protein
VLGVQAQAAELLRGASSDRAPPPRPTTAPAPTSAPPSQSAISRANYTASGLGAFAIPLAATRAGGLRAEQIANIDAATLATTSAYASALAAAAASATGDAS